MRTLIGRFYCLPHVDTYCYRKSRWSTSVEMDSVGLVLQVKVTVNSGRKVSGISE